MTPPFTRHPVASAMLVCVAVLKLGGAIPQAAQAAVMLDGYAEWRHEDYLVVDGQRVRETTETQWPGRARSISATPLGDEVRVDRKRTRLNSSH